MVKASLQTTPPDQPRISRLINDNYSVTAVYVTRLIGSKETSKQCQPLNINSLVADHVSFVVGHPQKKCLRPDCKINKVIKICERCFLCRSIEFCPECPRYPSCCSRSICCCQIAPVWGNMAALGASPKVIGIIKEGYTIPFRSRPNLTR